MACSNIFILAHNIQYNTSIGFVENKLKKIVHTRRAAFSIVSVGYAGVQCLGEIVHVDGRVNSRDGNLRFNTLLAKDCLLSVYTMEVPGFSSSTPSMRTRDR